ncbi:MAG: DNA-processing protein DprA, partial [Wenzhouxiangella sp.]
MAVEEHARAWLSLVLARGLGPRKLARLEQLTGSAGRWAEASDSQLREAGLGNDLIDALRHPDPEAMSRAIDWLSGDEHHLVTRDDALFPPLLRRIADPPAALFVRGNPECLVRPQIAIVGSRNATPGGLQHARSFAATLAGEGFVITSGLAAGIDGAAHEGCIEAGGETIAVTGTGPDQV